MARPMSDQQEGEFQVLANGQRKLLTPPEVAGFLQVKLPRIYELVKRRQLRAVRVGRQLRFRLADLEAFLERSATGRW